MNSKKVFWLMSGSLVIMMLLLFGGAYGVTTLLQQKSAKLVDLKLQDQVLSDQAVGLIRAKQQVKQYADLEQTAKSIVPQDKDQAQAVREIVKIAAASGIPQLSSVTFPASTLGGSAVAGRSSTTTTTPKAIARGSNLTQLTPVKGITGVYQLQITITQDSASRIPYGRFLDFLSRLEQNRRTAQVSAITLQPDSKNPNMVAFTLIINEFIKP